MASRRYDYDVIILGSGAAGSVAAQQLAKIGKSVAMVEPAMLGGQTPNTTSLPLQALARAARVYETARTSSPLGIRGTSIGYNYPSMHAWKDMVVHRSGMHDNEPYLSKRGITVIRGRGYFLGPTTISVGTTRFSARNFIIATGTHYIPPHITGIELLDYLKAEEAINLSRPPRRLAIIGAGPTGCELATIFATFGSQISLIESAPRILPEEEPEVSALLETQFREHYKIDVLTSAKITACRKTGLLRRLALKDGTELTVDEVIAATQRYPVTDIGLENAGVVYDKNSIHVNDRLQTSQPHIFAIGDCTGADRYAHTATMHGHIAAYNIHKGRYKRQHIAGGRNPNVRCFWTNPEIARVGYIEKQLKSQKVTYQCTVVPLDILAKANTSNHAMGFIKLIAAKKSGQILGATLVCPDAGEVIHTLALAIQQQLTVIDLATAPYIFGTWSEIIRVAAAKLARQ